MDKQCWSHVMEAARLQKKSELDAISSDYILP